MMELLSGFPLTRNEDQVQTNHLIATHLEELGALFPATIYVIDIKLSNIKLETDAVKTNFIH